MACLLEYINNMRKVIVVGIGNDCPKCLKPMERRAHKNPPKYKSYYFVRWDVCPDCRHIQHYDDFRSNQWKEDEQQASFFKSI